MPISGTLTADFATFYDACQRAEVSLKGFEGGAGKVETSLNRMADSFSGRKIIGDATLAAEAIERMGGASKLTEAEQAKVNRTVTEAIAKYRALGQEAPAALTKLHADTTRVDAATQSASTATGNWKGMLTSAAAAMGIAFSLSALTQFVGSVLSAASRVQDLSQKLGVSTEAVQRWEYAAQQGGATIDDVDKAVAVMNRTLGEGSSSTVSALRTAGLSFNEIRLMKPEDSFNAITTAVGAIEDPMTRARVAQELLGKSSQTLLPAMVDGFQKVGDAATIMADQTIKRLEAAQQTWDNLKSKAVIVSGEILGNTLTTLQSAGQSWSAFGTFMDNAFTHGLTKASSMQREIAAIEAGTVKLTAAQEQQTEAARRASVQAGIAAGKAEELRKKAEDAAEAATKKAVAEAEARAKALTALQDRLFGKDLTDKAALYATALGGVENVARMLPAAQAEMNKVMIAAVEVLNLAGKGASDTAVQYRKLITATTDYVAINKSLAQMSEDPFAKMNETRQRATQERLRLQMLETQGTAGETVALEALRAAAEKAHDEVLAGLAKVEPALAGTEQGVRRVEQAYTAAGVAAAGFADRASMIAQLNADADTNMRRGGIAAQYGMGQRTNATRMANGIPSFAGGGYGDFGSGTIVELHGKEEIVPWDANGGGRGATIHAPITINVPPGGDATRAGREAADALLARLKQRGHRV